MIYKSVVRLPQSLDPAAVFEELFEKNGLGRFLARRYLRLRSLSVVARGNGRVQFVGPKGRTLVLEAGDIAILPAGTGHQCIKAREDLLVVGAYPPFRHVR